jgi:hypothetical protein
MSSNSHPRALILLAGAGGVAALAVAAAGSLRLAWLAGALCLGIGLFVIWWATRPAGAPHDAPADPSRRRFLMLAAAGGAVWTVAGSALGWTARKITRPAARPIQEAFAKGMGTDYMELVRRTFMPGRSGELQLLMAPFNSANYSNESTSLAPQDPRTSHASVWMYLERIPLVVYAPGRVVAGDHADRVTLADMAPTAAQMIGLDDWPADRAGAPLPIGTARVAHPPKVVVTFIFDGGGWNVLEHFPDKWPNLKRVMRDGADFPNAIHGSFPAVTACAHATIGTGTYPNAHGITGHNIRDPHGVVRKTYGVPGQAQPDDILLPTLADLWYERSGGKAWVGEIGYQVWHLGMLGHGGLNRPAGDRPVGVFWDEDGTAQWQPHNPALYRLPATTPGLDVYDRHVAEFTDPGWDAEFAPQGRQSPCCSPPVVKYQGDLIEATFDSEPIGKTGTSDLLYINYKSPDYTGHVYGMASDWTGLQLQTVDEQLGRLVDMLEARFPGEYMLFVAADHGQCPLPDSKGGVRLDPIQLQDDIEATFGGRGLVEYVAPSEIWLNASRLWDDGGATVEDVAGSLKGYRYRQNIGPYVPRDAIEQGHLDEEEFAAVFASTYLASLQDTDLGSLGATSFSDGDLAVPTT